MVCREGLLVGFNNIIKLKRYIQWNCINKFIFIFKGVTFPSNHAIWSKWSPALERSTLVTMSIAGRIFIKK